MWQPEQYTKFSDLRLRPALDLLAAIPDGFSPSSVIDLGCGTGNITELLSRRFSDAHVVGLDSSQEMLNKAREEYPHISFQSGDLATLTGNYDLIFSNAALHWIKDHARLIPSLISCLNPGGVLAVQIPANFNAPSHELLRQAIKVNETWLAKMKDSILFQQFLGAQDYYRLFVKHGLAANLWATTYFQALSGENPIVEWVKGSIVSDLRAKLTEAEVNEILAIYQTKIAVAYPPLDCGTTLFPFTRLFFVATKAG